jgi:arylsulfatase A-like enzyme
VVSRDILPTFLGAAGIDAGVQFDGANLTPYLDGTTKGVPHEALFWRGGKGRAVRKGKWKLVEFGDSLSALYDLSKALGEKNDLSRANPDVVRELRDAWRAWSSQMKPAAWPPRFRYATVNGTTLTWEL